MTDKTLFYLLAAFFLAQTALSQSITIAWQDSIQQVSKQHKMFDHAAHGTQHKDIPSYCGQHFPMRGNSIELSDLVFEKFDMTSFPEIDEASIPTEIQLVQSFNVRQGIISYCLLPVRRNVQTGYVERLVSFNLIEPAASGSEPGKYASFKTSSADSSVLANGNWYKVAVTQTGVYRITPQFLIDCGFSVNNLPTEQLRVFGNGNGMLPEANDQNPHPELQEVPLFINDGGDGIFNDNDYALFYARSPHQWEYVENENRFVHRYNVYENRSFYFITTNNGTGKRMNQAGYAPQNFVYQSNSFDDFSFIEEDLYNLVGSGRQWFGDLFDFNLTYDYTLQFNDLDASDTAYFSTRAVARSTTAGTSMRYAVNGSTLTSLLFPAVNTNAGAPYVREKSIRIPFTASSGTLQIRTVYDNAVNSSATAWLDYIAVEVRRQLRLSGNQIVFRDKRAYKAGGDARYTVANANTGMQVWDVTDFHNVRTVGGQLTGNNYTFIAPSDSLRTFVAVSGGNFPLPGKVGTVTNQNLHGLRDIEMVIVTPPEFISEADRLADFHRQYQNLSIAVVTPEQVFNEFSSGMQDVTAIKLFLRHLYKDTLASKPLRYLLLFGDASYDYKGRLANDHNFVPIYQSTSSFNLNGSYCTDDFYGYLEDNEGKNFFTEDLEIGIGRMPVKTLAEAKVAVDKTIHYATNKACFGDWRNRAALVSDDADESWEFEFMVNTDRMAIEQDTINPFINFRKVYADSYIQEVKAGSQRYPQARSDHFRIVEQGNLVTTYLGHGGEVGWASERILQLADINGWTNYDRMPVFSTVTCEFTRVDDPTRVSAGEQLFLNPNGGAIALFSTLRPVFATSSTYNLNNQLFRNLFSRQNGNSLSLGEVVMATKNNSNSLDRVRFSLIGDPALYLAIPQHNVVTDEINGIAATAFSDTLKALSKVTIKGHIESYNGNLLSDFNGIVFPTVFDKFAPRVTLDNDNIGQTFSYQTQESVIYRGKASVTNGRFEFEFVVPLDINFVVSEGKISYYATDSLVDAGGYRNDILVGSLDLDAKPDDEGPEVRVFINDTNFVNGGLTDKDPVGLARIVDESGINTVGTGIGHDLLGILDGNTGAPFVLNDYFQSDLNSYQRGTVNYPFFDLPAGPHNLLVRAWDVHNNMGEGEIDFIVDESASLALKRVFNYPNPFHIETRFQFEHNRAAESLEVDIQIFDQQGALVKRIQEKLKSQGNRVNQITWDGRAEDGSEISSGLYVYRVVVRSSEDGSTATDYSKLVFIR
jgi:hypothetical protein